MNKSKFTLIEIVTVIAVILIISGIVLANINLPIFASLDETAKRVRRIMTDAATQATLQGKPVAVAYDTQQKELLLYPAQEEEDSEFTIESLEDTNGKSNPLNRMKIPENIEVAFPDYNNDDIRYRFFPDGSASGPEMTLTLKKRTIIVGVSHLTGLAYAKDKEP